jgi:hypothetical protein
MAETVILGFEIHIDSEDARELVECAVQRLTGHPSVDPDSRPGVLQIPVQADAGVDMPAIAAQQLAECADELGIADSWQLVSVLSP